MQNCHFLNPSMYNKWLSYSALCNSWWRDIKSLTYFLKIIFFFFCCDFAWQCAAYTLLGFSSILYSTRVCLRGQLIILHILRHASSLPRNGNTLLQATGGTNRPHWRSVGRNRATAEELLPNVCIGKQIPSLALLSEFHTHSTYLWSLTDKKMRPH